VGGVTDEANARRGVVGTARSTDSGVALAEDHVAVVELPRGVVLADNRVVASRSPVRLTAAVVPKGVWVRCKSCRGALGTGSTAARYPTLLQPQGWGQLWPQALLLSPHEKWKEEWSGKERTAHFLATFQN
jgi:hypothetical protein